MSIRPLPGYSENCTEIQTDEATKINGFEPKEYQKPILKALDSGFRYVMTVIPRRAGKDVTALNYMIRQMWERPGIYYYIFPTAALGRKVIWDSMTDDGYKFLDFFPYDLLIGKPNSTLMRISMRNKLGTESMFQIVGSNQYDEAIRGTNPVGVVFSEYAYQKPEVFSVVQPILNNNGGWALFISTPHGKNHLWELWNIAKNSDKWFTYFLTLDETNHIDKSEVERQVKEGEMSEDMMMQEYYCSFERGVEGSFYAKYVEIARNEDRVGAVPWDPAKKVHTAWDLGVADCTSIIFFQKERNIINVIDCYENSRQGLEHYAKILSEKPYVYGTHIAPHDIGVMELGSGITRITKARHLGINFKVADRKSLPDGIEAVRSLLPRVWFDKKKTMPLVNALENYRQKYNSTYKTYSKVPLHDWASHFADAMRYLALEQESIAHDGTKVVDYEEVYQEALREKYYGRRENPWAVPT